MFYAWHSTDLLQHQAANDECKAQLEHQEKNHRPKQGADAGHTCANLAAVFNGVVIPKWKPTSKLQESPERESMNPMRIGLIISPKILKSSEIIRNHHRRGANKRSCRKTARALTMRRVRTMRISFTTRRLLDC
jgi:hypothetical protein